MLDIETSFFSVRPGGESVNLSVELNTKEAFKVFDYVVSVYGLSHLLKNYELEDVEESLEMFKAYKKAEKNKVEEIRERLSGL